LRKVFDSPVFLAFGAFAITMLALVGVYLTQFTRAAAVPAEGRPDMIIENVVAVPEESLQPPIDSAPRTLQTVLVELGITETELLELPRPAIDTVLPEGLDSVTSADLLPLAAVPLYDLTPGSPTPGAAPLLGLERYTNTVIEPIAARWTVTGQQDGWVRVIVPVGRGALPSENPDAVNHHAVWVPAETVELEPELHRIEVSLTNRRVTVFHDQEQLGAFHVGIGVTGQTETPVGLCSVIARVVIQTGAESLLTSCQSEQLDTYAGADWATIALHEGFGFSAETGGAVSNGCIRVNPNNFAAYLDEIPIGTPVVIVP